MPTYDLILKFEGLKALCGGGMEDEHISSLLFPDHGDQERRSRLSRLKSAELPLSLEHRILLTEDFNLRINDNLRRGNKASVEGIIRPDDWDRPVRDMFAHIATKLDETHTEALDRGHAGMLAGLHALTEYRDRNDALLVEPHFGEEAERTRIPETAAPVDPLQLPLTHLNVGDGMTILLRSEVNTEPMRAWLFYVRDPDRRGGIGMEDRIWDQRANEMVFWHAGGPFELPPRFVGDLPGFPTRTRDLTGEVTAFLMLEPLNSHAVEALLRKPDPEWTPNQPPSFEAFAHMVTCRMRLFQRGNVKKQGTGENDLSYGPPRLLVRKYRVHPAGN